MLTNSIHPMDDPPIWRRLVPGVWVHTYAFDASGSANSMAFRLPDGGMVIVSPPCGPGDASWRATAALGPVRAIVAPNGMHHLGQAAWRQRFPDARCFASPDASRRIARQNPDLGPFEPLDALRELLGDRAYVGDAAGTRHGECWLAVTTEAGFVWYVCDVLANLPSLPRPLLPRMLFWLSGSAPGFRVFHLALLASANDKAAILGSLRDSIARYPPVILVPGHGEPLLGPEVAERTMALLERWAPGPGTSPSP